MAELSEAITPGAVVETLAARGVVISERTLREKARRTGACRIIGRAMFFMPDDLERLIDAMRPQAVAIAPQIGRAIQTTKPGSALEEARAKLKALKEQQRRKSK
ncbi:hypothetical protein [Shinella kummerowiae]|uniref:hypothetical protein n=1 Tax=Shinella kummerowiae TaxID=417745 RepID=UPI0021B6A4E2|nr:hypothetical protein [Shinella kummerowiae]MCT7665638.1 hypothetical protein [Shinella kummerowiae]